MLEIGSSPRVVSSARRVVYRRSDWKLHEFTVWGADGALCRCAALRARGSLLLWLGAAGGAARLGDVALAVPAGGEAGAGAAGGAARLGDVALAVPAGGEAGAAGGTALLGAAPDGAALPLARRLARALARPVYVCCGAAFDRFTLPLVERALIAEIKSRPEYFGC